MGRLKPATPEMFDTIHAAILEPHDPTISKEAWRALFEPAWADPSQNEVGYVLMEGDRIEGFLGLIFSEQTIDGATHRFANVTSWIAPEGGGRGAALLFPLRELRSHTITNLTSTSVAFRIFRRFGFEILDTHYFVTPTVVPRVGARWSVAEDERAILRVLPEGRRKLYRDHVPYVRQLVAEGGTDHVHLVYSIVHRAGLRVAKIHHVGGTGMMRDAHPVIGRFLVRRHRILAMECDERLYGNYPPRWSLRRELAVPRLYRSGSLSPSQISELYTEMVLLGIG